MSKTSSPPWLYNTRLRTITHNGSRCDTCHPWIAHLLQDLAESNPTLVEAELQRDTDICNRAETENADLRSAITDTHVALGSVRSELNGTLDSIRIANHDKALVASILITLDRACTLKAMCIIPRALMMTIVIMYRAIVIKL